MTRIHKIETWIAATTLVLLSAAAVGIVYWLHQRPIIIHGAVVVQDSDPHKQLPIPGVTVSAGNLAPASVTTDASGSFTLKLRQPFRKGHPMVLEFRHPQYQPFALTDYVTNHLYVVHLTPLRNSVASNVPTVKVGNVRVRYTVKILSEVNIGSAAKLFEVQNKGNVPCKGQHPCSPDGKWKASSGQATLDAGTGNEFRDARASCIAGPCPFTRIEGGPIVQGSQKLTVAARDWSDTATFVLEAEVFRQMVSQAVHWSYPIVFGDGLTFTLPSSAESVSIEADVDGQTITFPLGPALFLSWASCEDEVNPDKARVFRCEPKPGYRFQ